MLQSIERGKHTIAHAAPLCTIAGAVFIANAPLAAQAAAYHVAATGNDGNPGTADAPWQTLTTSANKLKPGDILYLHAGIYAQTLNENASGTASAPITIMAPPGELPVIDGTGVTLHDSWAPLCSVSGDYVTLSGLEVRHSSGVGMVLSGRHDVAKGINMHHTWDSGIALMGDYCTAIENRVWQTNLRNAAKPGSPAGGSWGSALHAVNPKAGGAVGVVIRNNIVFNNWGEGLNV